VNVILDDILTYTFSFVELKLDLSSWRNKDELFDLGIINWENHQQVIQRLKEKRFQMCLTQEDWWKAKIKHYKEVLVECQEKLQ